MNGFERLDMDPLSSEDVKKTLDPPVSGHPVPVSLGALFKENFAVCSRYLIIIYPVFLYFILLQIVASSLGPTFNPMSGSFWLMAFTTLSVQFVFQAGWGTMMYRSVLEWNTLTQAQRQGNVEDDQPLPGNPFWVFKEFIPGVGQFGIPFLLGGYFWLLMMVILTTVVVTLGALLFGIPDAFMQLVESGKAITPETVESVMKSLHNREYIESLSTRERLTVMWWSLLPSVLFVFWTVSLVFTQFWQPYLIIFETHALKAIWLSIKKTVRCFIPALTIYLASVVSYMMIMMLNSLHPMMVFIGQFLLMFNMVYFGLLTFLYLVRSDDIKPQNTPAS